MYHPKHTEAKAVSKLMAAEKQSHEETVKQIYGEISVVKANITEAGKILFSLTKKLDTLLSMLEESRNG